MTQALLADAAAALPWMRWLVAAWMALTTVHLLAGASLFAPDGLLPWAALAERRGPPWLRSARRRMSVGWLRAMLIVHLVLAAALAIGGPLDLTILCLVALLLVHASLIALNGEFWSDGATKMGMIAIGGTLLVAIGLRSGSAATVLAGILFTGGQLTISYAVAGWSKIASPSWRDGRELRHTMATEAWGHPLAARLIRPRSMALTASWGVILLEALFPLALLAPAPWLWAALGAMMLFHLATALFMGLNLFPWAFAAAYPAVIVLGRVIHAAL